MATTRFVDRPPVLIVRPLGQPAQDRPRSLWFGIVAWVSSWLLVSLVLAGGTMFWEGSTPSAPPEAAPPQALHTAAQSPTHAAERCAGVSLTWNAAAQAVAQFRRTRQPEYLAHAELLRNQARQEGLLSCIDDGLLDG